MCGEMASDVQYTRLLLGMGLHCFSVQGNSILDIKHIINQSKTTRLQHLSDHILTLSDPAEIKQAVKEMNQ